MNRFAIMRNIGRSLHKPSHVGTAALPMHLQHATPLRLQHAQLSTASKSLHALTTAMGGQQDTSAAGMHQGLLLRTGCWWLRDYHPTAKGHFLVFV
ncbi:unnamed protein product [Urochloa humidicola]